jgi:hypothetical protein
MDLRVIGWGGIVWLHLAQVRKHWRALAKTIIELWILYSYYVMKYLSSCTTGGFSRRAQLAEVSYFVLFNYFYCLPYLRISLKD